MMKKPNTPPPEQKAELSDTCLYCERVRWGTYQYLGKGQWRHAECYPGSAPWQEYYDRHPQARTDAGEYLRKQAQPEGREKGPTKGR